METKCLNIQSPKGKLETCSEDNKDANKIHVNHVPAAPTRSNSKKDTSGNVLLQKIGSYLLNPLP